MAYTPKPLTMDPLDKLRTCIINYCTFPWCPNAYDHLSIEERGIQGAATTALHLLRALKYWKIFPALEVCKVISSDWEPTDDEIESTNFEECGWMDVLGHGAVSELITHDVIKEKISIAPCRSIDIGWNGNNLGSENHPAPRHHKKYEWRNDHNEPFLVSINQAELWVEGCWETWDDDTRRPTASGYPKPTGKDLNSQKKKPVFRKIHVECHDGLLDRGRIREERIKNEEEWRYNSL